MARKGERVGAETRRMTRSSKPWPQRCARTPRTTQNAAPGARAPSPGGWFSGRRMTRFLRPPGAWPGTVTPLLITTQAAGVEDQQVLVSPQRQYSQDSLAIRLLGVAINTASADSIIAPGRLVVIGNTYFLSDDFLQNAPQNLALALNAVDWLAQDEALISIRSKNRAPPPLVFSSQGLADLVRYANLVGVPILVVLAGMLRLVRRRHRMRQPFSTALAAEAA